MGAWRHSIYAGAKAFSRMFAESLWLELRERNVDVLELVLGVTRTPAMERVGLNFDAPGSWSTSRRRWLPRGWPTWPTDRYGWPAARRTAPKPIALRTEAASCWQHTGRSRRSSRGHTDRAAGFVDAGGVTGSRHCRRHGEAEAGMDDLARIALAADDLGFDYLTCSEHVAGAVGGRSRCVVRCTGIRWRR